MFDVSLIIQIFVLLNPLSSFPFLMQAYQQKMNLQVVAVKAVITAFIIAVSMCLIGPILFSIFGITLNSFRVAGGLVLLVLGYNMIKPKEEKAGKRLENIDGLITIIATPMLTGPGTISFVTIKTMELGRTAVLTNLVGSFILVGVVFYVFSLLVSKVNPKIVNILSRIMGLFLMAVSVEMMAKGLEGIVFSIGK